MAETVVGAMAGRQMETDFVSSLLNLMSAHITDIKNRVILTRGYAGRLDRGRNTVIDTFLQATHGEYLLMLDTDMVFEPEHYARLLAALQSYDDKCVMSGIYPREDGKMTGMRYGEHGLQVVPNLAIAESKGRYFKVDATGGGFLLLPRQLFLDIQTIEGFDGMWSNNAMVNGYDQVLADDTSLCYWIEKAGYPIYLDKKVQVGHLKQVAMGTNFPESNIETPKLVTP